MPRMINQLIDLSIDIENSSNYPVISIIPKYVLFKAATANNVQYVSDRKPFWVPVLIDLIGLIISTDFNPLSIDLKLLIINFRISADSQL